MRKNHGSKDAELSPSFKLTVLLVASLTVLSLFTAIYLSSLIQLTPIQERLFDTCSTTWKIGFMAIVGLLAGRAIYNAGKDRETFFE